MADAIDAVLALKSRIANVFSEVPYPKGHILRPDSYDESEIQEFFQIDRWQDTPDVLIEESAYSLSFFSMEAIRFFIPAFLIWVLDHVAKTNSITVDTVLYSLRDSHGIFAENEREVIREFLDVLEEYWHDQVDNKALHRCRKRYARTN